VTAPKPYYEGVPRRKLRVRALIVLPCRVLPCRVLPCRVLLPLDGGKKRGAVFIAPASAAQTHGQGR